MLEPKKVLFRRCKSKIQTDIKDKQKTNKRKQQNTCAGCAGISGVAKLLLIIMLTNFTIATRGKWGHWRQNISLHFTGYWLVTRLLRQPITVDGQHPLNSFLLTIPWLIRLDL